MHRSNRWTSYGHPNLRSGFSQNPPRWPFLLYTCLAVIVRNHGFRYHGCPPMGKINGSRPLAGLAVPMSSCYRLKPCCSLSWVSTHGKNKWATPVGRSCCTHVFLLSLETMVFAIMGVHPWEKIKGSRSLACPGNPSKAPLFNGEERTRKVFLTKNSRADMAH